MQTKPIEVLMVDDDPADVDLTREALEDSKLLVNLREVSDGVEAMAYLRRQGPYADFPRPDLVLLDLNMPRKDGRAVLQEIRNDDDLRTLPVVVLTTSTAQADIVESYMAGANCYITKPAGLDRFIDVLEAINDFWFTVVKLPPRLERSGNSEFPHGRAQSGLKPGEPLPKERSWNP